MQTNTTKSELTADEQEVFDLINAKRVANGLSALKINDEVQNVARIKAQIWLTIVTFLTLHQFMVCHLI